MKKLKKSLRSKAEFSENLKSLADAEWWKSFGEQFGWTLYGWTFRDSATFRTSERATLNITGKQRDQIQDYIDNLHYEMKEEYD